MASIPDANLSSATYVITIRIKAAVFWLFWLMPRSSNSVNFLSFGTESDNLVEISIARVYFINSNSLVIFIDTDKQSGRGQCFDR